MSEPAHIYLDYNASTPIDPAVAALMHSLIETNYGNPSSPHWAGEPASRLLAKARQQVADMLGCQSCEVIFTSGGSESNNMVLKAAFLTASKPHPHIITSRIEHPAIIEPCRFLNNQGARITYLPVDDGGCINPADLESAMDDDTVLVSIMHANNEVGTIQPIRECADIARAAGVRFHTDAAQSVGKISTRVNELGVDFLSIAGHKLYAPKGIGALYIRRGIDIEPLVHGAGHESGRRAGTESVLLASALGKACELASDLSHVAEMEKLKHYLKTGLQAMFDDRLVINGHADKCLPNTLHVSFLDYVGADLLAQIPELAVSTGSACHAGSVTLSPVLEAMGIPPEAGAGAVRFSLGRPTTLDEIDRLLKRMAAFAKPG